MALSTIAYEFLPCRDNPFVASARCSVRHLRMPCLLHDVKQEVVIVHTKRIVDNCILANDTFMDTSVRCGLLEVFGHDQHLLQLDHSRWQGRADFDFTPIRKDQYLAIFHGPWIRRNFIHFLQKTRVRGYAESPSVPPRRLSTCIRPSCVGTYIFDSILRPIHLYRFISIQSRSLKRYAPPPASACP